MAEVVPAKGPSLLAGDDGRYLLIRLNVAVNNEPFNAAGALLDGKAIARLFSRDFFAAQVSHITLSPGRADLYQINRNGDGWGKRKSR
jgi:hypothetical protein